MLCFQDRADWMVFCYNTVAVWHLLEQVSHQEGSDAQKPPRTQLTTSCQRYLQMSNTVPLLPLTITRSSWTKTAGSRAGGVVRGHTAPAASPSPVTHQAKPMLPGQAQQKPLSSTLGHARSSSSLSLITYNDVRCYSLPRQSVPAFVTAASPQLKVWERVVVHNPQAQHRRVPRRYWDGFVWWCGTSVVLILSALSPGGKRLFLFPLQPLFGAWRLLLCPLLASLAKFISFINARNVKVMSCCPEKIITVARL